MPDNGQAVAGFVFSIVSVGLLRDLVRAVLDRVAWAARSPGSSARGTASGRSTRGETPKHKGLAQAGYVVGWVGLALAILATAGWILLIVFGEVDTSSGGTPADLRSAVAVAVGG